jgi:hypothetical protein
VEAVDTLFPAYSTHFIATEWNCGVKDIEAIDPYSSNSQCSWQGVGSVHILGENSGSKTVASAIWSSYYFINIPGAEDTR